MSHAIPIGISVFIIYSFDIDSEHHRAVMLPFLLPAVGVFFGSISALKKLQEKLTDSQLSFSAGVVTLLLFLYLVLFFT
ncbi:hypothetical protein ACFQH7_21815 [Microbulbifer taiwanensis]